MAKMAKNEVLRAEDTIQPELFTLATIPINTEAEIVRINAGFRATQRLSDLGLVPGTRVKVVGEAPFHGPLRLVVRGTQLALGRGLAEKVIVRPISEN